MPPDRIPTTRELFSEVIGKLRELGGSATTDEINERIISGLDLTEEQQQETRADGRYPQILQNLSEARTRLKKIGWIAQSARGVWALTEAGDGTTPDDFRKVHALYRQALERERTLVGDEAKPPLVELDEAEEEVADEQAEPATWQELLVARLLDLDPQKFERVGQRLLREAGFTDVEVTNRGADGGIDGVGQYRLGLLTFPVYWQSKRWARSVTAPDVQGFRGALSTQVGARGLFITTSTFTLPAKQEAAKPPQIDLIDGERLAELMKEYAVGTRTTVTSTEDVTLLPDFFDNL